MTGLARYLSQYLLDSFRERLALGDLRADGVRSVRIAGEADEETRALTAALFPAAETTSGPADAVIIPMAGGPVGARLRALFSRAHHKLLVPSPHYIYRFGMRRGLPALLWAILDRVLLAPLALLWLGFLGLGLYVSGLARAADERHTAAPARVLVLQLVPTPLLVGLLRRLRKRWPAARLAALTSVPEAQGQLSAEVDEVMCTAGLGVREALRRVRRFAPEVTVLAGGANYGLRPTYLKAALLARLTGARRRWQWEPAETAEFPLARGVVRPLAGAVSRRWGPTGGAVLRAAARPGHRRSYRRPPTRGPSSVQIGITEACNYHCLMCPFHNPAIDHEHRESERARMSYEAFVELVSTLARLGCKAIDVCGSGEPLTHPEAMEMLAFGRRQGLNITLATNAALITEQRARELVDMGLWRMHVSINAGSPESYAVIHPGTPPGAFEAIIARLRGMAEYAEATGQRPVDVEFSAVLNRHNMHEIITMVEAAREARAGWFMLIRMGVAREQADLALRDEDYPALRERIAEAKALAEGYGMIHNLDEWREMGNPEGTRGVYDRIPCYMGNEFSIILATGEVKFCCHCGLTLGTMRGGEFAEVWWSEPYRKAREEALALPITRRPLERCGCHHSCSHIGANLGIHASLYGARAARAAE
jgi:MoaA/NifB/PqqE/SkfB family radical SAM enzyme